VLNGIRRSVRSAILSPQQVSIIFFSGAGQIEQPQIYIDGGIDPWPDGFFDQIEKDLRELF
jgi:predicted ATPase